jgi:uncharacterized protein
MQTNLLWTGREYHSLENCLVTARDYGFEITSTIIGFYNKKIYKVDYRIKTNNKWETKSFEIKSRHSDQTQSLVFTGDGKGNWMSGNTHRKEFEGCVDIDIPLTPFTNTLPIKRLQLDKGGTQEIKVIYIDLLEQKITAVHQKYTRVSDVEYHYENVPNDFEATIRVDEAGFVIDYPSLFVRTALLQTNYQ